MENSDLEILMLHALNINIWSIDSGLRCFICGKQLRLSKTYFVNGASRKFPKYKLVCTNTLNSHSYENLEFTTKYLDMVDGISKATENKIVFGVQSVL